VNRRDDDLNRLQGGRKRAAMFNNTIQFLREVRMEMKKVSWPSRRETINSTVVIIIVCFVFAFFLGITDIILSKGIEPLFSGGSKTWPIIAMVFLGVMVWAIYDTSKS
jgi:preprotein translocase SecE subunit